MTEATFSEYAALLRERPPKFSSRQVNYRMAQGPERCKGCIHFFRSKDRTVCEIMRLHPDRDIDPEYVCDFQTRNGIDYPLLREGEK